ncbi:MAG: ATP-binding protein [Methanobrevibacter sp.]|jgi:DNA helicase HerA-like ATPase|nr:ATP-binding protein [Candidatus Methanoflexus mossambicus]
MVNNKDNENRIIGRCVGENKLGNFEFISKQMPKLGEYITLNYDNRTVLGVIDSMVRGSVSLNADIYDPKTVEKIREIEGDDFYIKATVRILGDINDKLKIPRTPPIPGTPVFAASEDILKKIFASEKSLKIGNLLSMENVEVNIDINKMVSRHLAILAMTGAGKSNTVSVIIDGILKNNGAILVFDMHGEYIHTEFLNGEVNLIKPVINPLYMSYYEIKALANIPSSAYIQERFFRESYNEAIKLTKEGKINSRDFLDAISAILNQWYNADDDSNPNEKFRGQNLKTAEKTKIIDVLNKVEDLKSKYSSLLDTNAGNIISKIELAKANVVDLSVADERSADVIVSHVLRNTLQNRKDFIHKKPEGFYNKHLKFPLFTIIEEAHILAPNSRNTNSKLWISRIAREGRKFGLGLCLVSQSPKNLDSDALSQVNNMILLRLVEPSDQRHVQSASENLSEDFLSQLPSLNVGEAIVLGMMVKIPTLVQIDEFKGRTVGGDLDILNEWNKHYDDEKKEIIRQKKEYDDFLGDF